MSGQNIDLGTFQWDTNKIENQLAANVQQMNKFGATVKTVKDQIKEQSAAISELEKKIESENKAQDRLNTQLQKGYISQDKYNSEIDKSNKRLDDLVDQQIQLGKEQAKNIITVNQNEQATKDLRLENNELNKLLAAGRTELSSNESSYRDLNKELNALKTEAKNLGAQLIILEQDGKENTEEYKRVSAQFAETSTKANELNEKFKAVDKSVGDNNRTVGDYKEQIKSAFSELDIFSGGLSGFIQRSQEAGGTGNLLKETFSNLATGISGATKASLGFIATPLGAVIAAIAVVVGVLYSAFKNLTPIMDKVEQGFAAISAVGNVLINSVVGLVTGTKSLSETFSGLGSSMKNAAIEAARLKKAQQDLEDAMAGQAIQNAKVQSQIDALIIKSKDRTKSEKERLAALQEAGKIEKENYAQNLKNATEELRIAETSIRQKAGITKAEEVELRKRYKNDSDFYNAFKELAEKRGQNQDEEFKKFQDSMIKYYDIYGQHNKFTERTVNANNKIIEKAEEARQKALEKAAADEEKRRQKAEAEREKARQKAEAEAKRELDIAQEVANIRTEIAKTELAEYIALNAEKYKDDKTLNQKRLQDQLAYWDEVKKMQQTANNEEEAAKQLSIDQKIQEIQAKKNLNQNDLNEIRNLNLEKENISKEYYLKEIDLTKNTEEQKKQIQANYDLQVAEQKKLQQAIQFQQRLLELEAQGASEYQIQKEQADQQFQNELADWAEKNKIKLQLDEEKYDLEQEILAARKELENQIQLQDDENEKLRLQNQLNSLNLIEAQNAEQSKTIAKSVDDYKLQSRQQVLSGLVGLFGKESGLGKIFAAAQITNDTVTNASKAFTQAAVFASNPLTAPLAPNAYIQGGIIIATGAGQLAKLVSPKGYATGGLISGGVEISRSNGDNRLITAKDGEVILNEDQQAMLGGHQVFKMLGVPGFATGGVVGTPASSLSTVQNSIINSNIDMEALASVMRDAVIEGATIGTHNGSQSGISDLSSNRQIANSANF